MLFNQHLRHVIVLLLATAPADAIAQALDKRQIAQTAVDSSTAPTSIASLAPTTQTQTTSDLAESTARSSVSTSFILVPSFTDPITRPTVLANNVTSPDDPIPIPLLPQISAATGLAGIVLLLTGLVYTFIALRWQLVHNFFSVAYLASIAVTCLIVFVQKANASAGTLVGYVVAVIASSAVLAAFTSPFAELTEGVGCFVGGFCMSMWFLCLKDDGLINSKGGKIIFVLVMSGLIGALGVFPLTRRWGLMTCIPFSGATAVILGVDCFSRVGYKEFWVYVWDIFPLGTITYPVTRAIRAESMCTIIIWVFGLVANKQLWKLLRKRQGRIETEQKAREQDLDRLELEAGMRAELTMAHEKDLWEHDYNESRKFASSVDVKSLSHMSSRMSLAESTNTVDMIEKAAALSEGGPQRPVAHQFGATRPLAPKTSRSNLKRPPMVSRASSEVLDSALLCASPDLVNADLSMHRSRVAPTVSGEVHVTFPSISQTAAQTKEKGPLNVTRRVSEEACKESKSASGANSVLASSRNESRIDETIEDQSRESKSTPTTAVLRPIPTEAASQNKFLCLTAEADTTSRQPLGVVLGTPAIVRSVSTPSPQVVAKSTQQQLTSPVKQTGDAKQLRSPMRRVPSRQPYEAAIEEESSVFDEDYVEENLKPRSSLLGPQEIENLVFQSRATINHRSSQQSLRHSSSRLSLDRRTSSPFASPPAHNRRSRRSSDSASIHLSGNMLGHRLSQQSLKSRFDSHQPIRPEDRPTAHERALRMAQFRNSLQYDTKRSSLGSMDIESRRQQMIGEKRAQDQHRAEQDMAQHHFGVMVENSMRNADGMYLHAKRLSKLQAQAQVK